MTASQGFVRIRFLEDVQVTVIQDYDNYVRGRSWTSAHRTFAQGTTVRVRILRDREQNVDVEHEGGGVTLGLRKAWFEVLPDSP